MDTLWGTRCSATLIMMSDSHDIYWRNTRNFVAHKSCYCLNLHCVSDSDAREQNRMWMHKYLICLRFKRRKIRDCFWSEWCLGYNRLLPRNGFRTVQVNLCTNHNYKKIVYVYDSYKHWEIRNVHIVYFQYFICVLYFSKWMQLLRSRWRCAYLDFIIGLISEHAIILRVIRKLDYVVDRSCLLSVFFFRLRVTNLIASVRKNLSVATMVKDMILISFDYKNCQVRIPWCLFSCWLTKYIGELKSIEKNDSSCKISMNVSVIN